MLDPNIYKPVFKSEVHGIELYMPINLDNGYHMSRYIAAGEQNIYSACGITKDLLITFFDRILDMCNDDKTGNKHIRTDVGTLINNLKYRTRFPIDQDCAIRMGAIYCFLPDELPNEVNGSFTQRKIDMCKGSAIYKPDHAMYDFFLRTGVGLTNTWKELESLLTQDYFDQRAEQLRALMPLRASDKL